MNLDFRSNQSKSKNKSSQRSKFFKYAKVIRIVSPDRNKITLVKRIKVWGRRSFPKIRNNLKNERVKKVILSQEYQVLKENERFMNKVRQFRQQLKAKRKYSEEIISSYLLLHNKRISRSKVLRKWRRKLQKKWKFNNQNSPQFKIQKTFQNHRHHNQKIDRLSKTYLNRRQIQFKLHRIQWSI